MSEVETERVDRQWHEALVQFAGFEVDKPHYQGSSSSTLEEIIESLQADKLGDCPGIIAIEVGCGGIDLIFSVLVYGLKQVYVDYEDEDDPAVTRYSDVPEWVVEGWITSNKKFDLAARPVRVRCFLEAPRFGQSHWPLIWVQFLDELPRF